MKLLFQLVLAGSVMTSAIMVVVSQHEARRLFVQLQELESARDDLNEEWGRLQLEQSTWATDDRIERLARVDLGMREPEAGSLVLLAP
jgi:cell division protein FtsL